MKDGPSMEFKPLEQILGGAPLRSGILRVVSQPRKNHDHDCWPCCHERPSRGPCYVLAHRLSGWGARYGHL